LIDKWETKQEYFLLEGKRAWTVDSTYRFYELQTKMRNYNFKV